MTQLADNQASELVTLEDLEAQLEFARAASAGCLAGVFGPQSLIWRVHREAALFLGAGRALLLQLAHPWIAAAIAEHSRSLADPIGRFQRTFDIVFAMVFGTVDQALAAARCLHRRHGTIHGVLPESVGSFAAGTPYQANDIAALRWVHATLVDTALLVHDLILPPLTAAERERYWRESRLFAALFGIPSEALPPDWLEFVAYNEAMWRSDVLTVSPAATAIGDEIFAGAASGMRLPGWYRAVTAQMLPARVRAAYGFCYGDSERRSAERAIFWIRGAYPLMPRRLRYVGPYQEATARLSGQGRPNLATQTLNRFWIGRRGIARG